MLVFWSACLSCLSVCQSYFNGWFRSQGKYRATLEFKSSGCAVSNNFIYDSSLSLSVSVLHSVHPPPFLQGGWGVRGGRFEPPTKFKKGRLDRTSTCGKEEVTLFMGGGLQLSHNKLKSEIFNDKKNYKQKYFSVIQTGKFYLRI